MFDPVVRGNHAKTAQLSWQIKDTGAHRRFSAAAASVRVLMDVWHWPVKRRLPLYECSGTGRCSGACRYMSVAALAAEAAFAAVLHEFEQITFY